MGVKGDLRVQTKGGQDIDRHLFPGHNKQLTQETRGWIFNSDPGKPQPVILFRPRRFSDGTTRSRNFHTSSDSPILPFLGGSPKPKKWIEFSLQRESALPARVSECHHRVPRVGGTRLAPNFPEIDAQRLENEILPRSFAGRLGCGRAGNRCSGRLEVRPFATSRNLCRRRARARARSPSRPPPNPPNPVPHFHDVPGLERSWSEIYDRTPARSSAVAPVSNRSSAEPSTRCAYH